MRTTLRTGLLLVAGLLLLQALAPACSLCRPDALTVPTLREEALQPSARLILYGQFTESSLRPDGTGVAKYEILNVLRPDAALGDAKAISVPRFVPVKDRTNPPRFLLYCDVYQKKLDPYRGVPIQSPDAVEYVKKGSAIGAKDQVARLAFYFDYLEHEDPGLAGDAFLEFAKADDKAIGQAAGKFDPARLRTWLRSDKTPAERLGIYAFLLGLCGTEEDASYLFTLLADPSERVRNAYDGILSGVLHKKPREGWDIVLKGLADGRTPLALRMAMVRSVRMLHGLAPAVNRANVLKAEKAILDQGELADMAVEDLRRWRLWDLTPDVLAVYGKKGYTAPIMERAIVRYALTNKTDPQALAFIAARRKDRPDLVKEVEEGLEFEK